MHHYLNLPAHYVTNQVSLNYRAKCFDITDNTVLFYCTHTTRTHIVRAHFQSWAGAIHQCSCQISRYQSLTYECIINFECSESLTLKLQARNYLKCIMWIKKPTRCHLVLYLFLLYKLLNMFRAILCPSSGADDLVVFFSRVVQCCNKG